jgi:hypothetical protein
MKLENYHENVSCLIDNINNLGEKYCEDEDCNWGYVTQEIEHPEHGVLMLKKYCDDIIELSEFISDEAKEMFDDYSEYIGSDIRNQRIAEVARELKDGIKR